jgi:hypothetical protein
MAEHTTLSRVWLMRSRKDIPVHRTRGVWTIAVRGPFTPAVTAVVEMKTSPDKILSDPGIWTQPPVFVDEHVTAGPDETDPRLMSVADLIVRRAGAANPGPWTLLDIRSRYPGCLVAAVVAVDRTCIWAGDPGRPMQFVALREPGSSGHPENPTNSGADADFICCSQVVHAWLAAGWPLVDLDEAHLIILDDLTAPRRGVQFKLADQNRHRTNEAASRVGC